MLLAFALITVIFPLNVFGAAPNLPQPGERMAAGIEQVTLRIMDGHDGVRVINHSLWRLANIERYEAIIHGDTVEFFGTAVLLYENGHRVYPIRESFADGERLTFFVDQTQDCAAELYVQFRTVAGTVESILYTLVITHDGVRGEGLHAADIFSAEDKADSPYQPTRPAGTGSVRDVLIPHPTSIIPRSTIPVGSPALDRVFHDVVSGHWARPYIYSVVNKGIMQGDDNQFSPGNLLTRAQAAQILYNAYASGMPRDDSEPCFPDIHPDAWYADAVAWIGYHGIVDIPQCGSFSPGEPATRELVAYMLYRVSLALNVPLLPVRETAIFTDQQQITHMDAVQALQRAGIISGFPEDGSFGPDRTITRAQMAAMIDRFTDLPGLASMQP
jgi:hypothetical protein